MFGFALLGLGKFCRKLDVMLVKYLEIFTQGWVQQLCENPGRGSLCLLLCGSCDF